MNEATTHDRRYTIDQEYTGEPGPRYVARFCLAWISSHDTAEQARRACDLYHQALMSPAHTHPGAQRAQTAKRKMIQRAQTAKRKMIQRAQTAKWKMIQCVQMARSASRYSWQEPPAQRSEYRRISREALDDARYWRQELQQVEPYV